jgi:hypothetical protein
MIYCDDRIGLAEFANDYIRNLEPGSALTMTIRREKSGAFSVLTATDASLEDIGESLVASNFFSTQVNT